MRSNTLTLAAAVGLTLSLNAGCSGEGPQSYTDAYTPGPAVEITADVESLAFGTVRADQDASTTKTVALTNGGGEDAKMTGVFISGAFTDYSVDGCDQPYTEGTPSGDLQNTSCEVALPAGATTTITVRFTPSVGATPEACASHEATLTLAFNSSETTDLSVALSGAGESDDDGDGKLCIADSDCDDANPLTYPGATEGDDNKDNDCDGTVDEDIAEVTDPPVQDTPTASAIPSTPTANPTTPTPDAPTVAP